MATTGISRASALTGPHGGAFRPPVTGANGVVASAHYLASLAGLRMLLEGGNAVDAAVAVAAALNVVEPFMSGIGGSGYMLVYRAASGEHLALDYLGTAPRAASLETVRSSDDLQNTPKGALVPGNLAGWLAALERFGTLDRAAVFAPAIAYAEQGVPLSPRGSEFFAANAARLLRWGSGAPYLLDGRVPRHGELVRQPDLARSFRQIVEGGAEAFYRGDLGRALVRAARQAGGLLDEQDLRDLRVEWQTPVELTYRGHTIRTVPPPCSGFQYLLGFGLLEGFELGPMGHNSAEYLHHFVEATKLAVADRVAYARHPAPPMAALLGPAYLAARRALIDPRRAALSDGERFSRRSADGAIRAGDPHRLGLPRENTTHFSVVDREGNAVSATQSLGGGFGGGLVAEGTGIALNNLLFWSDLDPESPNALRGGQKIEMCMSPAQVLKDGRLFLAIGTPGGHGILQTTAQMIANVIDFDLNVQAAIEAPRLRCALPPGEDPIYHLIGGPDPSERGSLMVMEDRIGPEVREELERRGHRIALLGDWSAVVGGGQGVLVDPETGARSGGADPRRDGYALAY